MSDSLDRMIDQACDRFEAAWKAGAAPRIEDHLAHLEPAARVVALRELIALDVFYRRKLGEHRAADDYRARFPDLDTASLDSLLQDVSVGGVTAHSTVNFPPAQTRVSNLKPGQKVSYFGDYELLEEIAQGGMGIVYKARQVSLNRLVALKMIRAGVFATAAEIERFVQEAKLAAKLDHPHIVPIFEVSEHEGQYYYAMKLIEGGSLSQRCNAWCLNPELTRSETRRRQENIAKLVVTTGQAVHNAHQHGIMHRDLKPGNILIDAAGEPHVSDFGLAKRIDGDSALTQSGAIVGTASYMSPEQANGGKNVTTQTDVYGLGAVLYELLTGHPPFKGATPVDTLIEVRQQEAVHPSTLVPRVDRDLETICLKCLEKDAERRYGSAEALLAELGRWQRGEPIEARRASLGERSYKWVKRRPTLTALIAVIFLAGWAMAAGSLFFADALRSEGIHAKKGWDLAENNLKTARREKNDADEARNHMARAFRLSRHSDYVGRIALATSGERIDDEILNTCPWDVCGWEWHYLKHSLRTGCRALLARGHRGSIQKIVISRDGRTLATFSTDAPDKTGDIKIWDTSNWRVKHTLGDQKCADMVFSADGNYLHSTDRRSVTTWEIEKGIKSRSQPLAQIPQSDRLVFNPDGTLLAQFGGEINVWNLANGQKTLVAPKQERHYWRAGAFSPDGKRFATVESFAGLQMWDLSSKSLLFSSASRELRRGVEIGFSRDGTRLAITSPDEVVIVDCTSGLVALTIIDKIISPVGDIGPIGPPSFSPDGATLAVPTDEGVGLFDLTTGRRLVNLPCTFDVDRVVAFSPDNRFLAATDKNNLRIFKAPAAREPFELVDSANFYEAFWSPDGKYLASTEYSSNGILTVWETGNGLRLFGVRSPPNGSRASGHAFSPDGKSIAAASFPETLNVFEIPTGRIIRQINQVAYSVGFSEDGIRLAGLVDKQGASKEIKIWDTRTWQLLFTLPATSADILHFACSPKQEILASACADGKVQIWNINSGTLIRTLEHKSGKISCLTFSSDGTYLASCAEDVVVWETATGREAISIPVSTTRAAFSPDGKRFVTGGKRGTIVWDASTGQELFGIPVFLRSYYGSISFSPDGKRLASCDGRIRIWDMTIPPAAWQAWEAETFVVQSFRHAFLRKNVLANLAKADIRESLRARCIALAEQYPEDSSHLEYKQP